MVVVAETKTKMAGGDDKERLLSACIELSTITLSPDDDDTQ